MPKLILRTLIILIISSSSLLSQDSTQTWKELIYKADSLWTRQQADSALLVSELCLKNAIEELGEKDTNVANIYHMLGYFNKGMARYDDAMKYYTLAYEMRSELLPENHIDISKSANNLGNLYMDLGDYEKSIEYHTIALKIRESTLDSTDILLIGSWFNLANVYTRIGLPAKAREMYERALNAMLVSKGPDDFNTAMIYMNLATTYFSEGIYQKAEEYFNKAIEVFEMYPESQQLATSLDNLANVARETGDLYEALQLDERALAIFNEIGPENSPDQARTYLNLGVTYNSIGDYHNAKDKIYKALSIMHSIYPEDHPFIAITLGSLANVYSSEGNYHEARKLYVQELEIYQRIYSGKHPDIANAANNYGIFLESIGNYDEAVKMYELAIDNWTIEEDSENYNVAIGLLNLGELKHKLGDTESALKLLNEALNIQTRYIGTESQAVAATLTNLGIIESDQKNYVEALNYHKKALTIRKEVLPPNHPDIAQSYLNLAGDFLVQAKAQNSKQYIDSAYTIYKYNFGDDHSLIAECKANYSIYYQLLGDYSKALDQLAEVFQIKYNDFRKGVIILSESEALMFSKLLKESASEYISCFYESDLQDDQSALIEILLNSKGILSDEVFMRTKLTTLSSNVHTSQKYQELKSIKQKINSLCVSDNNKGIEPLKNVLDSLNNRYEKLDNELALISADYRKKTEFENVSSDSIISILPENSVLIDFIKYHYTPFKGDSADDFYLALVLNHDGVSKVINLGNAGRVDELVTEYREHFKFLSEANNPPLKTDLKNYIEIASDIYEVILKPLEKYTIGKEMVLIAPDGALNLVSFAGLIDNEGNYLIEKYKIHYLQAGRDLIHLGAKPESGKGLLILGAPNYDASVSDRLNGYTDQDYASVENLPDDRDRNIRSDCGKLNELMFVSLPSTIDEVQAVTQKWNEIHSDKTEAYLDSRATEDVVKQKSQGKQVLHLATHGYYLGEKCEFEDKTNTPIADQSMVSENPLLQSGLVFAGCNLHGQGADSVGLEDGFLSAYEVTGMDLKGTDLVVLSACETGLGRVEDGEGVYGLRRAFQLAGARTVVSALWPVSDKGTAEMMSLFYTESSKLIPDRMREVQLNQIAKLRQQGMADHPYNWAGFIAIGDWK